MFHNHNPLQKQINFPNYSMVNYLFNLIYFNLLFEIVEEKGNQQESPVIDVGVCSLQGRRPYQEDQFAVKLKYNL